MFANYIFAIISKMLRVITEKGCSLESKLLLISTCSIRILDILEVITKCSTLAWTKNRPHKKQSSNNVADLDELDDAESLAEKMNEWLLENKLDILRLNEN